MKPLLLSVLILVLLGGAVVRAEDKAVSPKETKIMHMKIEGMTCSMCSTMIEKKLSSLCEVVSVDYATGQGQCTYETGKTSQDTVIKAVTDAGYKVVEVR